MKDIDCNKCRFECSLNTDEDNKRRIFQEYWGLKSYDNLSLGISILTSSLSQSLSYILLSFIRISFTLSCNNPFWWWNIFCLFSWLNQRYSHKLKPFWIISIRYPTVASGWQALWMFYRLQFAPCMKLIPLYITVMQYNQTWESPPLSCLMTVKHILLVFLA
jgi:hypothetical protein